MGAPATSTGTNDAPGKGNASFATPARSSVRRQRYTSDECLNETLFVSLGHARSVLRLWRDDYNHVRPHSGVGGLTPADAARRVVQHRPEGHHTNPGLQL
jgi:transposase InsO family protein